MERLLKILALKRGHGSVGERAFIDTILMPYAPVAYFDPCNNVLAYVVTTDPTSKTLFTAHIDTVHPADAPPHNPAIYDASAAMCYKNDGTPLGADDGAGVWLLLEMIDAGVPGVYLFPRGEERGGIGSRGMANHHEKFLQRFDRAIAFDRRGATSVITHQAGGKCASVTFATAMAEQLNERIPGGEYKPDDTGVYTDTAEFTAAISECTNISCGYYGEHSGAETLDVEHLLALRDACMTVEWDALPTERDPTDTGFASNYWGGFGGWGEDKYPLDAYDLGNMQYRDVVKWVDRADARDVADLLLVLADQIIYETDDNDNTRLAVGMI